MDKMKLEREGKLKIIYLMYDKVDAPSRGSGNYEDTNTTLSCTMNWPELKQWYQENYTSSSKNGNEKVSFMIDDLEAFELLADSPSDAKLFLRKIMNLVQMSPSTTTSITQDCSTASLIIYGRTPLTCISQYSDLNLLNHATMNLENNIRIDRYALKYFMQYCSINYLILVIN